MKAIDAMLPDEDYFTLRKTKYKGGGPWRELVELYCQSNGLNEMIYDQWNACTTLFV